MIFENDGLRIAIVTIISFVITYISIPSIVRVANLKHLFDEPNERASHTSKVPTLGGLAVFAGFVISSLIFIDSFKMPEIKYIIAGVVILFFVGIKDDILIIAPITKLIGQIFSASVIIYFTDIRITDLHGLFGINTIPDYIGFPLTIFTIIVITNGFNLIDGIDGLAGGVSILVSLSLAWWFFAIGKIELVVLSMALVGSILAFLRFNLFSYTRKIFMGDTGSLIIGLLISVLIIKFNEINTKHDFEQAIWGAPAVSFGILIIPLFDTLRVMFIRLLSGRSMFKPDKNHIHHMLLNCGFSHKKATLSLILVNIFFIIFVYFMHPILRTRTLITLTFLLAMIIFYLPTFFSKKIKK